MIRIEIRVLPGRKQFRSTGVFGDRAVREFDGCSTVRASVSIWVPLHVVGAGVAFHVVIAGPAAHQVIPALPVHCVIAALAEQLVGGAGDGVRRTHTVIGTGRAHVGEDDFAGDRSVERVNHPHRFAAIYDGIVAHDGDRDGLPNVIPEAMAMGVPVITNPVSGTTEAITHNETGFIAPNHDFSAWLSALTILQNDDETYRRIGAKARQWVEANYDNQVNATLLARKLKETISAGYHHRLTT